MSEKQDRVDLAKYDAMTTQELEALLRLDAREQESDTQKILYIMEVLAERKKANGHAGKTAQQAYESFQRNYMPEAEAPVKAKTGSPRWLRGLTAAAVVLAILLVGSVTADAFGFHIWKAVIQWTQETFHLGDWGNPEARSTLQFESLQAALEEGNTPSWLVPTYFPPGFTPEEVKTEQTPAKKVYQAKYTNGENRLFIAVRDHLNESPVYVEQSNDCVEEYTASGITYHLFENNGQVQAIWIVDSYECNISANISMDELKQMITSIKKG